MAARIDWARWTWPFAAAFVAAPVGLLAGIRPELAVVAALGAAFGLIAFVDLAMGVALFTLLTFFELIPDIGGAVSLTKLTGGVLAIAWFATLATRADARADLLRQHPAVSACLIFFVVWAALSFIWADEQAAALGAAGRLGLNALLVLIVFTAMRTERDVVRVLTAFVIGAALAMGYGLLISGQVAAFGEEGGRLSGQVENANQLAATLVATVALALGLAAVSRRSPALRVWALAAAVVAVAGILLTLSRGGLVALAAAGVTAIIFGGRWRPQVAALTAAVATCALVFFFVFAPAPAQQRVTESDGGTGRSDIWKVGWRMVEDNTLAGVGAGNFQTSSIHYLLSAPGLIRRSEFIVNDQKVAHNLYLQTIAELGIVGLTLLLLLIAGMIGCGVKAIRRFELNGDRQMEILARVQLVALVGILASLIFSSDQYKKQLWLLLAMMPSMLAIARSGRSGKRS